ncbi:hypothetical protein ANCCEY_15216, partial [Ancylostoma ceylanicum]
MHFVSRQLAVERADERANCQVVSERQKLMADQIKIRRRQRKDSIMNLQRDQLASTISAAAALSGQMNFGLGGLGSLL